MVLRILLPGSGGGRWFLILLPGSVQTVFKLDNLRPLGRGVTQQEQVLRYRWHL